jgi:hypothetical protein
VAVGAGVFVGAAGGLVAAGALDDDATDDDAADDDDEATVGATVGATDDDDDETGALVGSGALVGGTGVAVGAGAHAASAIKTSKVSRNSERTFIFSSPRNLCCKCDWRLKFDNDKHLLFLNSKG